jgi:RsiW-degrading membrane proteinase PrsW (M82 family)
MNLDHYSYLIDRQHRFLLTGIVLLVMTVVFTLSGETLERYHAIVYRAKEPKRFWWDVVLYFLAGLFSLVSICARIQTELLPPLLK